MANTLEFVVGLNAVFSGSEQFGQFSKSMSQAQSNLQGLQSTAGKLSKLQSMNTSLEASKQKLMAAQEKVRTLREQMKQTPQPTQKMRTEFTRANIDAQKLSETVQAQRKSIGELKSSLEAAGVSTKGLAGNQDQLTARLNQVTQAQQRLTEAQSKYNNLKQSVSWNNIKGDVMSSLGIIKSFEVPVKTMMNFEQAMANVRAVNGANDSDFAMLRDQALELGRTTQFSASQAANTQESLARGGFDPQQIKNAMPAVLAMAAAEGMDLAAAGDIVVKTLGGMGFKDEKGNVDATQSARVADILANMSASSATNITELGEGMKIAAPVMSQLGVSIEQLGAYLGGMANKGFVGSEAGNALASSAMRLSKLPTDTKKALADLGVATRTKSGKMREFPDIMKALNEAFNKRKMGEAQRMDYLARIFGQGQGKAMLGFMDAAVSGQIDTLETSNKTQAQGKSQAMADVRNNTLVGDLAGLSSAWEGFMISVGKPLEDWSRNIVQGLTQAISWVTQLMKEHEGLADVIVKVVAGLGALKVGFTVYNISKNVTGLVGAFFQLKSASAAATAAMQGASQAGGVFSTLGSMVKGVWGIIAAHPFVAIGAAVGAAAILIYQNWDKIKETAGKCWEGIKEYASVASQWVKDKFQALADWWNSWSLADVFSPLSSYADTASNWAQAKWQSLSDWVSSLSFPNIFAPLSDFASNAWANISNGWNSLTAIFTGWTIPDIFGSLTAYWDKAAGYIKNGWENVKGWFSSWFSSTPAPEAKQGSNNRGITPAPTTGYHGVRRHAIGGIMTTPHIGLVAEAGPEAIIPLSDKSRGVDVLMQAAELLGVSFSQPNISLHGDKGNNLDDMLSSFERSNNFVRNYNQNSLGLYSGSDTRSYSGQPQINITVNSSPNNDNDGLADLIARKVQDVLQDLQERQERLAYA